MPRLSSDRTYGLLIVVIVMLTGLWLAYDTQASIHHPGWFAGWRSTVWCKTVVYGPEFESATVYHYPGKKLPRVFKELGVPLQIRTLYLNAERQESVCYESWSAAAQDNATFQLVTQEYAEVLAGWTEADYQQAVIMLNLRRDGMALLGEIMKVKQRSLEQSRQE